VIRERFETRIALESFPVTTNDKLLAALGERFRKAEVKFVS